MKHLFLLVILLFLFERANSQDENREIDSLMNVAQTANDSLKFGIYNDVGFYYIFNDPEKGKKLLSKALKEARQRDATYSIARLTNTYGIYFDVSGKYDSAQHYFKKSLDLSKEKKYTGLLARATNSLGMSNWNQGNYQVALDYFFSALELNSTDGEPVNDAKYLNNIGLIYQEMNLIDKALEYHYKALDIRRKLNLTADIPLSLNNIAINLQDKGDFEASETILKEARALSKANNDLDTYFSASHSLARLYQELGRPAEAIPLLKETIEGRERTNIGRRANLNSINNIIEAYVALGNVKEAIRYVALGEQHLKEFPDLKVTSFEFYYAAARTNFLNRNDALANTYYIKSLAAKDSIFSSERANSLADLETKFKVSEKERDLAETRANLAESELEVKQRNSVIFGSLGLIVLLALLGYFVFSRQQMKNQQLEKEKQLTLALNKIETQNQLQEQRLRISRDLHDNIGSQLTFVTSSVDNLKYGLKESDATTTEKLGKISAFTTQTIYELRDTIWAMNKHEISTEDLQARIANFIDQARDSQSEVVFNFEVSPSLAEAVTFTSMQGMNIYRIIQEAVNNSLKYANASTIDVELAKKGDTIVLNIRDDGRGFDPISITPGNGLSNIRKRASDLGGKAVITSEENKGTAIEVNFS